MRKVVLVFGCAALVADARLVPPQRRVAVRGGGAVNDWRGQQPMAPQPKNPYAPTQTQQKPYFKVEEIVEPLGELLDRKSRNVFVRRVYGLLSGSLALTAASSLTFASTPQLAAWLLRHPAGQALFWTSAATTLVSMFALAFVPALRHGAPALALYGIFSVAESLIVGAFCSLHKFDTVFLALLQTAVATLGLTAYGFQPNPRYDLTGFGSLLGTGLVIYTLSMLLGLGFGYDFRSVAFSGLGALLFCAYIVYDTQLIVGGNKRQMDTRDYVLAAITLYLDIVNLFMKLVELSDDRGGRRGNYSRDY